MAARQGLEWRRSTARVWRRVVAIGSIRRDRSSRRERSERRLPTELPRPVGAVGAKREHFRPVGAA